MAARGIRCGAGEVLVVSGSQQGLDLVARVLARPRRRGRRRGAVVLRRACRRSAPPRLACSSVPADADGMRTDAARGGAAPPPAQADLHPAHLPEPLGPRHEPGAPPAPARRSPPLPGAGPRGRPLLRAALRGGAAPVAEGARPGRRRALPLHVLEDRSSPGCGSAGWSRRARSSASSRWSSRPPTSTPGRPASGWSSASSARGHWRAARARLRGPPTPRRRDAMLAALEAEAPEGLTWQRPEGGFYVWCRLPAQVPTSRLLAHAGETGVAYLPGRACFVDEPAPSSSASTSPSPTRARSARGCAASPPPSAPPLPSRGPPRPRASSTRPIV